MKLISYQSKNLPKNIKKEILKLKIENWNYNYKSQSSWFDKNIFKTDLHNCLFVKEKLAGYTCLRKRKFYYKNKKLNFLLFDTLIIKKNFRNIRLGQTIMRFNNRIIKKYNYSSYLIATKNVKKFYEKNKWKHIKKNFIFKNHKIKKNKILMGFNYKKDILKEKRKLIFVI